MDQIDENTSLLQKVTDSEAMWQKIKEKIEMFNYNDRTSLIIFFPSWMDSFCMDRYDLKINMPNHPLANPNFVYKLKKEFGKKQISITVRRAIEKITLVNGCCKKYKYSGYLVMAKWHNNDYDSDSDDDYGCIIL